MCYILTPFRCHRTSLWATLTLVGVCRQHSAWASHMMGEIANDNEEDLEEEMPQEDRLHLSAMR